MTVISVILLKLSRISELVADSDSDLSDLDHESDEESDQVRKKIILIVI